MMDAETAISRLSFAEAQHSSTEAMVAIARHRSEFAQQAEIERRSETQAADDFAERARDAHRVDRTA